MACSLRQWQQPPLLLREAPEGIDIPLLPSPQWRRVGRSLAVLAFLYPAEMLWHGQWLVASAVLLLLAWLVWLGRAARIGDMAPRRLVCTAAGNLFIVEAGLPARPVVLHPASLRLGSHLLLMVRCESRAYRLLLGPDNLSPSHLAALQRRVPTAGAG